MPMPFCDPLLPISLIRLKRLKLWVGVFGRFFPVVWVSLITLVVTGYLMIFSIWQTMTATPVYVHIMNGLGMIMILVFMHVFFAPYKQLKNAVLVADWPTGGKALAQIRMLVGVNIIIGVLVISVASAGRYFG